MMIIAKCKDLEINLSTLLSVSSIILGGLITICPIAVLGPLL